MSILVSAIYRGTYSNCGEHPHAVQILHTAATGGDAYLCGGTLITPKHVLTAAHCAAKSTRNPTTEATASDLKVSRLQCDEKNRQLLREGGEEFDVVHVHAQATWLATGSPDHDMAILELATPMKYHPFLADPAALPAYEGPVEPSWEQEDRSLIILGAGTVGTSQTSISDWLRQVRVDVLTKQHCDMRADAAYGVPYSTWNLLKGNYFCAVDEDTLSGACGGDSGSGAVEYVDGRKRVVGVAATGPVICSSPNHFNIYGGVSAWMPWIKTVVGASYALKLI
ncbi:hypothetical protein NLU13_9092 [Sarocladium strictum]|uniref:Peptidase S1 domain-containing protein n=1 Tax=Sarocladium strictum TaxID=5046 RepID=A0AA39L439_SARSR|nr:hypothetical protein NLU13_9092 [Sarocladium strictum]